MQSLSVDCGNCRERKFAIIHFGYTVHLCHNFIFVHTRTNHFHRLDMHVGSHITCFFYFCNFFGRFIITLCHHRTDKRHGTFLTCRRNTQPIHEFQLMFGTVRRKIMHRLTFLYGFVQIADNPGGRKRLPNAYPFTLLFQSRLRTHPYNMIDSQFVSENDFFVLIDVNNSGKSGKRQAEIVEESRILTITESIIFIIQSLFVISQE